MSGTSAVAPTVALVQARMASTRLPGKVLKDIAGLPMLLRVVQRVSQASTVDQVVVATTVEAEDDLVAELCKEHGVECYRGDALDVLDRFIGAARAYQADVIVRITADCPLIDPELIDRTVQAMHQAGVRFAANRLPWDRSFPIGLDVEVCTRQALEEAASHALAADQREHVMPYLYQDRFADQVALIRHDEDLSRLRWTVDEPADLELVRRIYSELGEDGDFGWQEVLELVRAEPELSSINAHVQHRGLEPSA